MAEILQLLWQWYFLLFSFLAIYPYSVFYLPLFISSFPCLSLLSSFFCLLFVRSLYESTSHMYSQTCSQTNTKELLPNNNKSENTTNNSSRDDNTYALPFIALLHVCASLPSVGGAAALLLLHHYASPKLPSPSLHQL